MNVHVSDLRILAGKAKGRALAIPHTARPTGSRVRKSLFDILEHRYGAGSSLLDLYAGAGGVGLEAASRDFVVTMVEKDAKAAETLERNRRQLRLEAKVLRDDARRWLLEPPASFDIVFLDPPYTQDLLEIAKIALESPGLVADGGVLIVQHPEQIRIKWERDGFTRQVREYGSNTLTFYWKVEEE